jgi:hypothetical protein
MPRPECKGQTTSCLSGCCTEETVPEGRRDRDHESIPVQRQDIQNLAPAVRAAIQTPFNILFEQRALLSLCD